MYQTCPACGFQKPSEQQQEVQQCPNCGLVFKKWLKAQLANHLPPEVEVSVKRSGNRRLLLLDFFFPSSKKPSRLEFGFHVCLYLLLLVWGWNFLSMDLASNEIGRSFLHNVNLVFHEAGHVFFQIFGRFMMFLGGSLFQVLLPLMLMLAFLLINKEGFAASVSLWWAGQSLMDIAPYIADARALRLPLLGGGTGVDSPGSHDWANILRQLGWLNSDLQIAGAVDFLGALLMVLSLLWGGIMLRINYKNLV